MVILIWIVSQFIGGTPAPVATQAPAPTATKTATDNPLVVDGVNIGGQISGILTGPLAGVTAVDG